LERWDAVADTVKRRGLERAKGEAPEVALGAHARSLDARGLRRIEKASAEHIATRRAGRSAQTSKKGNAAPAA
jgi:hypothetical protein